jgi:excisionase family DNA binding protein
MSEIYQKTPLTIPEAARILGVSDQMTRLALLRGELTGFRVGRNWRIHPESIARLMTAGRDDSATLKEAAE